jgi:hypothetical protein
MPNIYALGGGGGFGNLGAGYGYFDPLQKKKRPMFSGAAGLPGAGGVDPGAAPAPNNQPVPRGLKLNIYEDYPGFNPLYRGDQLGGMDKQRGATPDELRRLSDATMAWRASGGLGPRSRAGGLGVGYGETEMGIGDPIKKLLMARYGGL